MILISIYIIPLPYKYLHALAVTLKDVKLFIVNRQNVSEIFVNIHNVNLFNVKPKELSKAGLYM